MKLRTAIIALATLLIGAAPAAAGDELMDLPASAAAATASVSVKARPAAGAPMVITPTFAGEGEATRPAVRIIRPRPVARQVRWVVVPMPHLRPRPMLAGSSDPDPLPDFSETTASITAAPAPEEAAAPSVRVVDPAGPPVVTAKAEPEAVRAVDPPPAPDPVEHVESDDLVGDPTLLLSPPSTDMNPALATPAAIDILRPTSDATNSAPVASLPPGPLRAPYELVRTLQSLQDQMAAGSTDALAAQRVLRVEIDRQFAAADPKVWQDHRNAEASVTYVLSGGTPTILARLAKLDPKPAVDPQLVAGVLAYVEGDQETAGRALSGISLADLPPSMSGQVALAQSALAVRADPQRAMRLLSMARLMAPGTLVEEAALRRQIYVADQLKATKDVESLARQYLDRFRHSVYAGNFRARFAAAISHMDFVDKEAEFPRLDDMLAMVEPDSRCQLYLTVALASVVKGRVTAGRLAAERALALADPDSASAARARLYHAAALVADAKSLDAALSDFGAIDSHLLTASDQSLYRVVDLTLQGVRSGTEVASLPLQQVASLDKGDTEAGKPTPIMDKAQEALKAADAMLKASPE
jgi:chemotaxis protein MotC